MLKIISGFILLLIALVLGFNIFRGSNITSSEPVLGLEESNGEETVFKQYNLSYLGRNYKIVWAFVDPSTISLYPNFDDKKTAKNLMDEYGCKVLINGGFYSSKDGQNFPIGLFISEGEVLSRYRDNKTHNGIFSINSIKTPMITREASYEGVFAAVQTGPVIIENNETLELSLVNDKYARRMVMGVTGANSLIFISVYEDGTSFSGPLLKDLPQIISKFDIDNDLNIADATNLDGGAASAFFVKSDNPSEEVSISEVSPIGSFFCAK